VNSVPRLVACLAVTAFMFATPPPTAVAANESTVTIVAPKTVKPGARFNVRTHLDVQGSDDVFLTGGFLDFQRNGNPATSRRRCPATPKATFAADKPQIPWSPGLSVSTDRARNTVSRTGTVRYCIWVINSKTYEQEAAGAAYIKTLAKKRPAHRKVVAKAQPFSGTTSQKSPIRFKIAAREIRALTFTANFRCSDGQTVLWATHLPTFAFGSDGRFSATPAPLGTINDAVSVSGRVNGRHVTGSVSETYTSVLGNTCKSGTVKFTATAPKKKR
jgi:hypothetical protein